MPTSIQIASALGDDSAGTPGVSATNNLPTHGATNTASTTTTYGSMVAGGEATTTMDHATGNVLSLTAPVIAGGLGNNRIDQTMANANFSDFLHRNVLVKKFTDFTNPLGGTTFQPWVEWTANAQVAEKLRNFLFIRGSMIVSGVLVAPPLSFGLAIITFYPSYEGFGAGASPVNYCTTLPHVVVDLSTSSDFQITLPWVVSSDWGNLHDTDYAVSWTASLTMLSPLVTAIPSGCASGSLSIFCRPAADLQLSGATYQSGRVSSRSSRAPHPEPSPSSAPAFNVASGGHSSAQDTINGKSKELTGYKPSELLKGLGSVGYGVGGAVALLGAPIIGAGIAAAASAASTLGAWADWFGFTRETHVPVPVETLSRNFGNTLNCDGQDGSAISALFQSNGLSIDPAINGTLTNIDETSMAHICSRYSLIGKFQYTVGDSSPEDQLIPVTPCLGQFGVADSVYHPTPAGYVAGRFGMWRGDMHYIFYPVISAVHRGALQFIWQPIPRSTAITDDLTNISVNTIVDLAAATPIEITVGYNNDLPMCYTDFYALDTVISSTDYSTLNGYLRVRAIVPFAGSVCGQNIDVLVFARAGDNMEFAQPVDDVFIEGTQHIWGRDIDIQVELQSGTVGADGQKMIHIALVPSSGPYPVADIVAGECIRSLRALMQKPTPIYQDGSFTSDSAYMLFDHSLFRTFDPVNYLNYFGSQYLAFAGSKRIKFIQDREASGGFFSELVSIPYICSGTSAYGGMPLGQLNPTSSFMTFTSEVTLAYYHSEKFLPAYKGSNLTYGLFWDGIGPSSCYTRAAQYTSLGPDARLTFYRCPNVWVFRSVTTNDINVFEHYTLNVAPPGPAPLIAEKTIAPVSKRELTLDQYRARTGRTEFRVGRFSKPPPAEKVVAPVTTTEAQATREDVVA